MDRAVLIAYKHETQSKLAQAQRDLERLEAQWAPLGDAKPNRSVQRRMGQLQTTVEQLMAEEYRLRLAIDQAGGEGRGAKPTD